MSTQEGPYGKAEVIPIPDVPESAETVCQWLVTAPAYHPMWSQYLVYVVRLRDGIPGFPDPVRDFEGATHELCCFSLNPMDDQNQPVIHTPASILDRIENKKGLPYLTPVNVVQQHEATDAEMERLAELSCWSIIHGFLEPEATNGAERIRMNWLGSATKTLAHMRGEEHAS